MKNHLTRAMAALLVLVASFALLPAFQAKAEVTHELLNSFGNPPSIAGWGPLVLGADGYFWGVSRAGGAYNEGAIYKVKTDGSETKVVASLGAPGQGSYPDGDLVDDGAGCFWGVTNYGGANDLGTLFKVNEVTGEVTTVVEFTGTSGDVVGSLPLAGLLRDSSGCFWGTTFFGGDNDLGTIFKVQISTGTFTSIGSFTGYGGGQPGQYPRGKLASDGSDYFWGTTDGGGNFGDGTVFKVSVSTGVFESVLAFTPSAGRTPYAGLVSDGAGFFWGVTSFGAGGYSTVFKVEASSGAFSTVSVLALDGAPYGPQNAQGALVAGGDGFFWGTSRNDSSDGGLGAVYKVNASTGEATTVAHFTDSSDGLRGANPIAGLVQGPNGYLWGTTSVGGTSEGGTVFKVNIASGATTSVVDLGSIAAGNTPTTGQAVDGDGNLWGTTAAGGTFGAGTIFKLNPITGEQITVLNFTGTSGVARGSAPIGELLSDAGFMWGTTQIGGLNDCGTVFKVNTTTGELSVLVDFTPGTTGINPGGGLVKDSAGFFWGCTTNDATEGRGAVYKVDAAGSITSVVEFAVAIPSHPGTYPCGELVSDGAGSLWGVCTYGSANTGGDIFKVDTTTGMFTLVSPFASSGSRTDASIPQTGLTKVDGFFWGVSIGGGLNRKGTVFKVNIDTGVRTLVASFSGIGASSKGSNPKTKLVSDGDGALWGMTSTGGVNDLGTVFKVDAVTGAITTEVEFTGINAASGCGSSPGIGSLYKAPDGNFYGATKAGGPGGAGTVFRLRLDRAITKPALQLSFTSVMLRGRLNPNGFPMAAGFEWGSSPTLEGASFAEAGTTSAGTTHESVSATLLGLNAGATYYYRVRGTNSEDGSPWYGQIVSFNTAPTVQLIGADTITFEAAASYTDAGATATDASGNVLIPVKSSSLVANVPGTYSVTWTATDSEGSVNSVSRTVNVVDTTAPVPTAPIYDMFVHADSAAGATVTYPAVAFTEVVGVASYSFSIPSGSFFPVGATGVQLDVSDAAGNTSSTPFTVNVLPYQGQTVIAQKGEPVAGAGIDPLIAGGAVWGSVGAPAINESGHVVFFGKWAAPKLGTTPAQHGAGIFMDDTLIVRVGDAAPGMGGETFASFKDPLIASNGDLLFLAKVKGSGTTTANDSVLYKRENGVLKLQVREGDALPGTGGLVWRAFSTVAISSESQEPGSLSRVGVVGFLLVGPADVTVANDLIALMTGDTGGLPVTFLREGAPMDGQTIKSFLWLRPGSGTADHGRQFGAGMPAPLILLSNKVQLYAGSGILKVGALQNITYSGGTWTGATFKKLGLPCLAPDLEAGVDRVSFVGSLTPNVGGVPVKPPTSGLFLTDFHTTTTLLVPLGAPVAAQPYWSWKSFKDPVSAHSSNGTERLAFLATIQGSASKSVIGVSTGELGSDGVLVRTTDYAADVPYDARWKTFVSLAQPADTAGPIFTAKLGPEPGAAPGTGSVTTANDLGCWAVTSAGEVHLQFREGEVINGKTLRTFSVLKSASGGAGTRSFNSTGGLVWLAYFTDGTTAIMKTQIP